jgi:hypothetical protein
MILLNWFQIGFMCVLYKTSLIVTLMLIELVYYLLSL